MAIKGKGRSSKRRGVAAAPKPVYVTPKKPLLARRGFRIGVIVVVALAAIVSVATALVIKHDHNQQQALKATETEIVRRFGVALDNDISGIGQPFQTTFTPFPAFSTDVSDFNDGKLSADEAVKKAETYAADAKSAESDVTGIPAATLIHNHADLITLNDGQNLIRDALQVYQQAADSFKLAAQSTGKQRDALVAHTQSLLGVASHLFDDGYQKLVNERQRFDLLVPTNQQGAVPPPIQTSTVPSSGKHKK